MFSVVINTDWWYLIFIGLIWITCDYWHSGPCWGCQGRSLGLWIPWRQSSHYFLNWTLLQKVSRVQELVECLVQRGWVNSSSPLLLLVFNQAWVPVTAPVQSAIYGLLLPTPVASLGLVGLTYPASHLSLQWVGGSGNLMSSGPSLYPCHLVVLKQTHPGILNHQWVALTRVQKMETRSAAMPLPIPFSESVERHFFLLFFKAKSRHLAWSNSHHPGVPFSSHLWPCFASRSP